MYCICEKVTFRVLSWSKINFKYLNSTRCMFITEMLTCHFNTQVP